VILAPYTVAPFAEQVITGRGGVDLAHASLLALFPAIANVLSAVRIPLDVQTGRPVQRLAGLVEHAGEGLEPVMSRMTAIQELLGGSVTAAELEVLARAPGALRSDLERRRLGLPAG
jgi:hypothetical protein